MTFCHFFAEKVWRLTSRTCEVCTSDFGPHVLVILKVNDMNGMNQTFKE